MVTSSDSEVAMASSYKADRPRFKSNLQSNILTA